MSHIVITTTPSGMSAADGGLLNLGYARSVPGLLKIAQMVALLISFLCVYCARGWTSWAAFLFLELVALSFFVVLLTFFLVSIFRLQRKMPCINWMLTEFFHYALGTLLIFIASVVAAVKSAGASALVTAWVFGFIATFLMAISLWTTYKVSCGLQQTGATV
ncbi:CKLF-like MARVEL transmembrane domain-containing protein 7 [Thalassophryne amazonica]|uniref:CKLF-like MARVEL transmembrane domain-containing protein 7 n=1 Tax=Thalassophryne amazonica TaxID=390379 RepID=UPI001471A805|nr:CKLF-like MARVEL transmembrane domain-containing protein 7 [Thalassophryne amazonica]